LEIASEQAKTCLAGLTRVIHELTHCAQRCRSETEKFIVEDLYSSALLQFKKYHPSGNLKFNNLGISQSLKLRILAEIILPIYLKLNFTTNTSGRGAFDSAKNRNSAKAANAKVRNRQITGTPIIL